MTPEERDRKRAEEKAKIEALKKAAKLRAKAEREEQRRIRREKANERRALQKAKDREIKEKKKLERRTAGELAKDAAMAAARGAGSLAIKPVTGPARWIAGKYDGIIRSRIRSGQCAGCGKPIGKNNHVHKKCTGAMNSAIKADTNKWKSVEQLKEERKLHLPCGCNKHNIYHNCHGRKGDRIR